jgi:hypothetical protein
MKTAVKLLALAVMLATGFADAQQKLRAALLLGSRMALRSRA